MVAALRRGELRLAIGRTVTLGTDDGRRSDGHGAVVCGRPAVTGQPLIRGPHIALECGEGGTGADVAAAAVAKRGLVMAGGIRPQPGYRGLRSLEAGGLDGEDRDNRIVVGGTRCQCACRAPSRCSARGSCPSSRRRSRTATRRAYCQSRYRPLRPSTLRSRPRVVGDLDHEVVVARRRAGVEVAHQDSRFGEGADPADGLIDLSSDATRRGRSRRESRRCSPSGR